MRAFKTLCCMIATCMAFAVCAQQNENVPPVRHSRIGDVAKSADGSITLKVVGQKLNYGGVKPELRDTDVWSPKSVHFHPNGKKYYINSLEGCRTMVYDARTNKKLAVIHHKFTPANAYLWAKESGFFPFTHYTNKKNLNTFWGRPVESTFSHRGRYLWIPYYRRSYDINAQDPSAISVIDTRTDSIIKVFETGPLPKMVATTHSGKYLAVTHWGDNTVGILDISSPNPDDWHYVKCVVVDYQLKLNLSMTTKVDRDCNSGYLLRGTVFTPDDHYMLIALQHNVAHLGIVTGLCLSEAAVKYSPRWVGRPIVITAVLSSISTSLAEILGGAIALQMLFGIPIVWGSILTVAAVLILLFTNSYKKIERAIISS